MASMAMATEIASVIRMACMTGTASELGNKQRRSLGSGDRKSDNRACRVWGGKEEREV